MAIRVSTALSRELIDYYDKLPLTSSGMNQSEAGGYRQPIIQPPSHPIIDTRTRWQHIWDWIRKPKQ